MQRRSREARTKAAVAAAQRGAPAMVGSGGSGGEAGSGVGGGGGGATACGGGDEPDVGKAEAAILAIESRLLAKVRQ